MIDWGAGAYEYTAADLEPAAEHLVALAGVREGEAFLDVGCGTGNAARLAAAAGAQVTGVDPAQRLLEVAAERVPAGTFVCGVAEELPFGAEEFDVAVSVFALIFSPDRAGAVSELLRVLRPGGRALVSAWLPEGALHAAIGELMRAMGAPPPPPGRLELEDPDAAVPALEALGAAVKVHDASIEFRRASAAAWMAENDEHHPMSIAARRMVSDPAAYDAARRRAVELLESGNEDPQAWRVTSRYVVYELRHAG